MPQVAAHRRGIVGLALILVLLATALPASAGIASTVSASVARGEASTPLASIGPSAEASMPAAPALNYSTVAPLLAMQSPTPTMGLTAHTDELAYAPMLRRALVPVPVRRGPVSTTATTPDAAVVTVNTATVVVDGNFNSIADLIDDPGDDDHISLPEAVFAVNNTGPGNTIIFNLAPGALISFDYTLSLTRGNTTINGDVDADGDPDIVLEGGPTILTLDLASPNNVISGLVLVGLGLSGVNASNNTVRGNYIGTNHLGLASSNIPKYGIQVAGGAHDNLIERNLVSGIHNNTPNVIAGIYLSGGHANIIRDNSVGVSANGAALPNEIGVALLFDARDNIIGGTKEAVACLTPCNLIGGNEFVGVDLRGPGVIGNRVQGNFIGVDRAGNAPLPHGVAGVVVALGARDNVIGGAKDSRFCAGPCNLISGNSGQGIQVQDEDTIGTLIKGNFIGLDLTGTRRLPNGDNGVLLLDQAAGTIIGGPLATTACDGACNAIGGNAGHGVLVLGATSQNTIAGNYVGARPDGQSATVGNGGFGVAVLNASGNRIGGTGDTVKQGGNRFAANGEGAVAVAYDKEGTPNDPAKQNSVRGNLFLETIGRPIDLQPAPGIGVDEAGANTGIQAPALVQRAAGDPANRWRGIVDLPNGSIVDLYAGGGRLYAGRSTVQNKRFEVVVAGQPLPLPAPVMAMATDPQGNTSEFSITGSLELHMSNAVPGGEVYATAILTDTLTNRTLFQSKAISVTIEDKAYDLRGDGQEEDFYQDERAAGWLTAPADAGNFLATLSVSRTGAIAVPLTVTLEPQLAILTDLHQLHEEFKRTGGDQGPDFYRMLRRMADYAEKHTGVLVDARAEIERTSASDATPYKNYDYHTDLPERVSMGTAIDNHIGTLNAYRSSLRYLAIVGDDAVVPFFRRTDPIGGENAYPPEVGSPSGSPTLDDSAANQIMTDVPYASFSSTNPDTVSKPPVDLAVGRIYAQTPQGLQLMFDAYERPVALNRQSEIAAGWSISNERGLDGLPNTADDKIPFQGIFRASVIPPVSAIFTPTVVLPDGDSIPTSFASGRHYWFDGEIHDWTPTQVIDGIRVAALSTIVSHANHLSEVTESGTDLRADDVGGLSRRPGHLVVNYGCHTGYSTAFVGHTAATPIYRGFATAALSSHLTWVGATTYEYGRGVLGLHDRLLKYFLQRAVGTAPTVGIAYRNAQRRYALTTSSPSNTDITVMYGIALYGLPTQPLAVGQNAQLAMLAAPADQAAEAAGNHVAPMATGTLDVTVDTPHFRVVTDPGGSIRFELPNTGTLDGESYHPLLPQVERDYRLPSGAQVTGVEVLEQTGKVHPNPVSLQLAIPFNSNTGPLPGSPAPLSNPYPAQIYRVAAAEVDDGTLLSVVVNPLQYNPTTRLATLLTRIRLRISYTTPASTTTFTALGVNDAQPVDASQTTLPVRATISSASAQSRLLTWRIVDMAGTEVEAGAQLVTLKAGSTNVTLTARPVLHPGPMLLTATLGDGESAGATAAMLFVARGRSLDVTTDRSDYDGAGAATINVSIFDETGAGVNGLAASLRATLDGTAQALSFQALGNGHYRAMLPLGGRRPGSHLLEVRAPNAAPVTTGFRIAGADQKQVFLPLVRR